MKWIAVLVVLLMIPTVHGLGIAPARKTIDFSPSGSQELSYRIYNSDRQNFVANIKLSDELEQIATIEPSQIEFTQGDAVKSFKIKINFGDTPPQKLDGKITISASPLGSPTTTVSASITISSKLSIQATGAVVAKEATSEEISWTPYALAGLVGLLIIATLGILIVKPNDKPSSPPPTIPPPLQNPPQAPPPTTQELTTPQDNTELEAAKEIEAEIEHLREMR